MRVADLVRQVATFVVGILLLVYDALAGPPHDWVVLLLGLVMVGIVPAEWIVRAYNGHGGPPPGSGSSSSSSSTS